jgi:general secretion pathway protein A
MPDQRATTTILLEIQGVLNQTLPGVFRDRIPAILATRGNFFVQLLITTEIDRVEMERCRQGSFFVPARDNLPTRFTWKAGGALDAVLRRFRLEFLRHLGPSDRGRPIYMSIVACENAFAFLAEPVARQEPKAPQAETVATPARTASAVTPPPEAPWTERLSLHEEPAPSATPAERPEPPNAPSAPTEETVLSAPMASDKQVEPSAPAPEGETLQEPPIIAAAPDLASAPAATPAPDLAAASDSADAPAPAVAPAAEPRAPARPVGAAPTPLPGNFYQDWFGFERMPFNNTPDPRFFLATEKHQEALSRLIYAISERKGFVMISGEIGSGKSTLCRTLLTQLPKTVRTALITHTHIDGEQLVRAIAEDLGLAVAGLDKHDVLRRINEYLIEQLAQGAIVCVIIDEAQNLSAEALEEVRMISNLETEQEKLVQLILLGQPELRDKICRPNMEQLRQRIAVQYHLLPLTRAETSEYIRHRLRVAGHAEPLHFRKRAMAEAYRCSGGVPRVINNLCDNALLTLYTRQQRVVTPQVIREAARDLNLERPSSGLRAFLDAW